MPTNLNIDDRLLNEALKVGGHRTKRETVNEALEEYIQRRRRLELTKLFGKVDFRPDWDYKKDRRGPGDALITALALNRRATLFAAGEDFEQIAKVVPLRLLGG